RRTQTYPAVQTAGLLIQFAEPITALVIYPFIIQFVRDTGVTGGDETKTGFAGIIEAVFFLAECLTVVYFGRASESDRYGRRPVLLFGPVGLAIAMLGFGPSKRFWSLVIFRCLQGAFNGNIGVSKSVMAEVSDSTNVAEIYSLLPLMWTVGATLGPFIGGTFANPASRYPDSLGKIRIFQEFPYLLPCALAGALALTAFAFGVFGLKETLPSAIARQAKAKRGTETEPLIIAEPIHSCQPDTEEPVPRLRDLIVRPVLIALLNHGFLSFCQMSYEVLATSCGFLSVSRNDQRIPFSPLYIGRIMGAAGLLKVLFQLFLSAKMIRYFGARKIFITAFCSQAGGFLAYPFLTFFARRAGRVDATVIAVIIFQMSANWIILAYIRMHTNVDSAPTQNSLGAVNGLAQMVSSTLRSIAPTVTASSTLVSHRLLGSFVLCGLSLCGLRAFLLLPRKLRSEGGS
ncbi:major facilitator superfamily domain-containing protein, partial [Mycena maculata]